MLPRLTAEESKLAATRTAVGSGAMDADSQRATRQNWDAAAAPPPPPQATPSVRLPLDVDRLRAIGVGVRRVPRVPAPDAATT